jgi:hypothetical protein
VATKDPDIFKIIERIGDHYQNNVSNRFVRKALVLLELPQSEWDRIENLAGKAEYYRTQGFQFEELYEMIMAMAHLVYLARTQMLPNVKTMLTHGVVAEQEKVLRDMAAQNFPVNLALLSDMINELYIKTIALDRAANPKKPLFERIPELKDLGRYLVMP